MLSFFAASTSWCAGAALRPATHPRAPSCAAVLDSIALLEPVNTASLALAFGSTGIAVQRDRALKKSEKELAKVQGEVQQLRSAFVSILAELEADVDASSARLEELQALGKSALARSKDEIERLKKEYEEQAALLRETVGDYSDRVELQQNTIERQKAATAAAEAETQLAKQRAVMLEEKLATMQAEAEALATEAAEAPRGRFRFVSRIGFGAPRAASEAAIPPAYEYEAAAPEHRLPKAAPKRRLGRLWQALGGK